MPSVFSPSSAKTLFTTTSLAFLIFALCVLTDGCESSPQLVRGWSTESGLRASPSTVSRGMKSFFYVAIEEYLNALTRKDSFRYIVFLEKGQYRGWMSVVHFQRIFHQNGSGVTRMINQGNYTDLQKDGMHVGSIVSTASAFEALDHLNRTKEEGIAVLTPTGALVGIASLQAVQAEARAQSGQPI